MTGIGRGNAVIPTGVDESDTLAAQKPTQPALQDPGEAVHVIGAPRVHHQDRDEPIVLPVRGRAPRGYRQDRPRQQDNPPSSSGVSRRPLLHRRIRSLHEIVAEQVLEEEMAFLDPTHMPCLDPHDMTGQPSEPPAGGSAESDRGQVVFVGPANRLQDIL